jgi:glycosyltransferase involved in cell wall biosynthesis
VQEPRCFGSHVLPITSHGFRVPGDNGVPGVPGVILLEALASGLPVVASRILGNVDLVLDQENGLLFSIDESCEMIAAEIVRLWKSPARWQRMSDSARVSVSANYDWRVIAATYERLFDGREPLAAQNGRD